MNWTNITYTIVFLIIGIVITVWFILEKKYKHRAREKKLVKGRKIIRDYRASDYTDKKGVKWWKLAGNLPKDQKLLPIPPEEAIELNHKGKMITEFYRTPSGEVIFSKEAGDISEFPEEIISDENIPEEILELKDEDAKEKEIIKWKRNTKETWLKNNNIVSAKKPITTNQRLVYLMNLKEAESRLKNKDKITAMLQLGSMGIIALVVVSLMVFWGDIAAPATAANSVATQQAQTLKETAQILKDIKHNVQTIDNRLTGIEQTQGTPPVPD